MYGLKKIRILFLFGAYWLHAGGDEPSCKRARGILDMHMMAPENTQRLGVGHQVRKQEVFQEGINEVGEMLAEVEPYFQDEPDYPTDMIKQELHFLERLLRADDDQLNQAFRLASTHSSHIDKQWQMKLQSLILEWKLHDYVFQRVAVPFQASMPDYCASLYTLSLTTVYQRCLALKDCVEIKNYLSVAPEDVCVPILEQLCLQRSSSLSQEQKVALLTSMLTMRQGVSFKEAVDTLLMQVIYQAGGDGARKGISAYHSYHDEIQTEEDCLPDLEDAIDEKSFEGFAINVFHPLIRQMPTGQALVRAIKMKNVIAFRVMLDVMSREDLREIGWERVAEYLYHVHGITW